MPLYSAYTQHRAALITACIPDLTSSLEVSPLTDPTSLEVRSGIQQPCVAGFFHSCLTCTVCLGA